VGAPIQFQHRWGDQPFTTHTLLPGHVYAFCWPYGAGLHTSPPLQFMLNRAVGGPVAFTNYALTRVQSPNQSVLGRAESRPVFRQVPARHERPVFARLALIRGAGPHFLSNRVAIAWEVRERRRALAALTRRMDLDARRPI